MKPLIQLNDLSNELLLPILQHVLESELDTKITRWEKIYLNRFTPSAKTLRRVCRRWKSVVDLPSNYASRSTRATLLLDYCANPGEPSSDVNRFRAFIEESKGLTAVSFALFHFLNIPGMKDHRQMQESISLEIQRLAACKDRLIELDLVLMNHSLATHVVKSITSLGRFPRLIKMNICLTPGIQSEVETTSSSEFLRSDTILNPMGLTISNMSKLSSLILELPQCSRFLSLCNDLRDLTLRFPHAWNPAEEAMPFALDSLTSLRLEMFHLPPGHAVAVLHISKKINRTDGGLIPRRAGDPCGLSG